MVIIFNKVLNDNKKVYLALRQIYGVGAVYSKNLCSRIGISEFANIEELPADAVKTMVKYINAESTVEKELQASIRRDIKKKIKLKTYQGRRHLHGLPVHGQNTKNNSKTAKKLLKQNANFYK